MIDWLRRAWAWITAGLGAVVLALVLLLRRSNRQRDEERGRAESAAGSAQRGETLRVDEAQARREAEAAQAEIDRARREASARMESAREELRRVPDTGLAAEVERRRKAGRLP